MSRLLPKSALLTWSFSVVGWYAVVVLLRQNSNCRSAAAATWAAVAMSGDDVAALLV